MTDQFHASLCTVHDDPRAFENVPEPDPDVRDQIIGAYVTYLQSEAPPEKGLHQTISETMEGLVKPRQVHKVLETYRHELETAANRSSDPLAGCLPCLLVQVDRQFDGHFSRRHTGPVYQY